MTFPDRERRLLMYPADLPRKRAREIASRPTAEGWAALSAIWARLYIGSASGWQRWPEVLAPLMSALAESFDVAGGHGNRTSNEARADELERVLPEDDGSSAWQDLIDLTSMLGDVLRGRTIEEAAERAVTWYLDGRFNILGNDLASRAPRGVISEADARRLLAEDPAWVRTKGWIDAL